MNNKFANRFYNKMERERIKRNVLDKGKVFMDRNGIHNPIKFSNIDLSKFEKR